MWLLAYWVQTGLSNPDPRFTRLHPRDNSSYFQEDRESQERQKLGYYETNIFYLAINYPIPD